MKLIPSLAAAAVFVSSQAMATGFVLPYHIDAPYKGSAAVQLVGACSITKVYAEAQWGEIKDSTDAVVGEGLITKDGVLVAVVEEAIRVGGHENGMNHDDLTHKHRSVNFVDLSSDLTAEALQALATGNNCTMLYLQTAHGARASYDRMPATKAGVLFNENVSVLYPFGGAFTWKSTTTGAVTTDAQRKFIGKITFNGKRTITGT